MPRKTVKKLRNGSCEASHETRAVISSVNPKIGPKINIFGQVFDQDVLFQIDTGAQVSCLPRQFVPSSLLKTLTPAPFQLESYNGSIIKVYGCLKCDIQIGSIDLTDCIFQVVDDTCSPILGTPEIFENKITLDIKNSTIIKENRKELMTVSVNAVSRFAGLRVINKSSFYSSSAKSSSTQIIAPRSTAAINVKLAEFTTSTVYALPEQVLRNKNLEIYDQVVQVNPAIDQARIQVANNSDTSIEIREGDVIARLHEVHVLAPNSPQSGKFRQIISELKVGTLPTRLRQKLHSLISNFADIFAVEGEKLGTTDAMTYEIDTGTAAPTASQR